MDSKVITTTDVDLNVVEAGSKNQPCILFLHGFPDDHSSWAAQMEKLQNRFHVIAYDLRGVGQSILKTDLEGAFSMEALLSDLQAVITEMVPSDQKVHIVGHNWGAVIGWYAIQDSLLKTRIASFTSISGLHIGMLADWLKQQLLSLDVNKTVSAIKQLVVSSYVGVFNLPMVERTFHWFPKQWMYLMAKAGGLSTVADMVGAQLEEDELEARLYPAIELFRQNLSKLSEGPAKDNITTPVQIIIPTKDFLFDLKAIKSVSAHLSKLKTVTITAGHWVHKTHAEEVSGLVSNFIGGISVPAPSAGAKQKDTRKSEAPEPKNSAKPQESASTSVPKKAVAKKAVKKKAAKKKAVAKKAASKKATPTSAKNAVVKKSEAAANNEASSVKKDESSKNQSKADSNKVLTSD